MSPILMLAFVAFLFAMVSIGVAYRSKKNDEDPEIQKTQAEVERRWSAQCEPGENLWAVCINRALIGEEEWYILTSKRLVIEGGKHPCEIPLDTITKIKVTDGKSVSATTPSNAQFIEIRTSIGKVTLVRSSQKFDDIAKCFLAMRG